MTSQSKEREDRGFCDNSNENQFDEKWEYSKIAKLHL
jgi:hypothetical protein